MISWKLNWKIITEQLKQIKIGSYNSICVSLIHGWKFPSYELEIQTILNQLGHKNVTLGHEISKTIKYIRRTHTSLCSCLCGSYYQKRYR